MKRSREYTRDYSTEWIELLVILIILTVLGVAMYFSFRYDPNHNINKGVIDEKGTSHPIKASIQAPQQVSKQALQQASQKAIHMVPIEIQTGTYVVKLTAVRDKKVDLTRVRIPRSIRLIPETK
jgi:hypothetical protein